MRIILIPLLLAGTTALTACSGGASFHAGDTVRVVAAENFWGSIVRQLAGDDAEVTSIISKPETDPHDYEPTPRDARAIASAQLVIENGIGYDPWAQQLLDVDGESSRTVVNVGKLLDIDRGGNPHQWYSQAAVAKVIDRVTSDLQTIDPAHRSDYERRKRELTTTGLARYNALIAEINRDYAGARIGASESIVAPLAKSLGLKLVTPDSFLEAIAEGSEPTASDKATVDAQIRDRQIDAFVFNRQNSTPDVQSLVHDARRAHVPVATVTETLTPSNATFQAWQERQLRGLLAALRKGSNR